MAASAALDWPAASVTTTRNTYDAGASSEYGSASKTRWSMDASSATVASVGSLATRDQEKSSLAVSRSPQAVAASAVAETRRPSDRPAVRSRPPTILTEGMAPSAIVTA